MNDIRRRHSTAKSYVLTLSVPLGVNAFCTAVLALTGCASAPHFANRPPVIQEVTSTQFGSNSQQSGWKVEVAASDPDGDPVTMEFIDDSWGVSAVADSQDPHSADVQVLHEVSAASLTIRATDGRGGEATHEMDVRHANRSPLIQLHSVDHNPVFTTGQTNVKAIVTDPDQDSLTVTTSLTGAPPWAALTSPSTNVGAHTATLILSGAPQNATARIETVAEDGRGGRATSSFDIGTWQMVEIVDVWQTERLPPATAPFSPYALAFDSSGNLYVSDIGHSIIALDPNGQVTASFSLQATSPPNIRALLVDESQPTKRLLVGTESGNHVGIIPVHDAQGTHLGDLAIDNETVPHYLFRRTDGNLLISDNRGRMVVYDDQAQSVLETWGGHGSGLLQYEQPRQITRNPLDGSYYIADRGNHRIKHVREDGTPMQHFTGSPASFNIPHGVTFVGGANVLAIGDTGNDRIVILDPDGAPLAEVDLGADAEPRYILQGPDGRLYVASYRRELVYVLDLL